MDSSICIDWSVCANIAVALATCFLALLTWKLSAATKKMADEAKEGNERQLGVQTWLTFEERFDSPRMLKSRRILAELLSRYNDPDNIMGHLHSAVTEEVLEMFESIGAVYNIGLLNEKLAETSFGFHAVGWWQHAEKYIENERNKQKDKELFIHFQKFATKMAKLIPNIDMKQFVSDEMHLPRFDK